MYITDLIVTDHLNLGIFKSYNNEVSLLNADDLTNNAPINTPLIAIFCTPDKAIHVFHLISPMLSHPGPEKKRVHSVGAHVHRSSSDFYKTATS